MSWLDGLRHRLRVVRDPAGYDRDLRAEIEHHRHLDGVQGYEATDARRRFGNETYYREESRAQTWLRWADVVRQDVSYAWRSIRRTRGVTAMIVLTLSLGLGVNAATFAVLDRLFLRAPSGLEHPDELRRVWFEVSAQRSASGTPFITSSATYPRYTAVSGAASANGFALYDTDYSLYMTDGAARTRIRTAFASASYFDVLGVRPAFGRTYTRLEDSLGHGSRVIVLSHRFWRTAFGGDSSVIGRRVTVEADPYTVIGVLRPDFHGLDLQALDAWIPLAGIPRSHWIVAGTRGGTWWRGNRASGFTVVYRGTSAPRGFDDRATLAVRARNRADDPARGDTLMRVYTSGLLDGAPGNPAKESRIGMRLAAVAAVVLIIACANVINLLLARAVSRRREIAVRLALGISRARLVRLLTTETVLLALLAGAVATLFAWAGGRMLRTLLLPEVVWYDSPLHWRVVAFALTVSVVAGLVAGLIPALQASNPALAPALKEGTRGSGSHRSLLRRGLLVTQAALSVVLLAGATLFIRSLDNVRDLRLGYDTNRIVFAEVGFPAGASPPAAVVAAGIERVAERLASHNGIEGVARSEVLPMRGIQFESFYWDTDSSQSLRPNGPTYMAVTSEFFRTVGMKIVRGAVFDSRAGAPKAVMINEAMAQRMWGSTDVIGRCIRFATPDSDCYAVAGVVENARQSYVIEEPIPLYYLPLDNLPGRKGIATTLIVRAAEGATTAVSAATGATLRQAFPRGEAQVRTFAAELEPDYRPWRLGATLFTAMGLLALLVAIVGIYSTVSYDVTQRTHEFGVRIALGARVGSVVRQVVFDGLRVVVVGVVAGVGLALAAGTMISSMLYGVRARDPVTMGLVACTLLVVAAGAGLVPAFRASRVDPMRTLRSE